LAYLFLADQDAIGPRPRARARIARPMRILMLSAQHTGPTQPVRSLAIALARAGHGVDLIAPEQPGHEGDELVEGVRIAHVADYPPLVPVTDRLAWALQLGAGILERATRLGLAEPYDLVHAHGWETAWPGAAAKNLLGLPMVSTLRERAGGSTDEDKLISQAEWWLTYESRATIVPSNSLRLEIETLFELPVGKQVVVSDAAPVAATIDVYERALADDAELRRRGADRPSLRVILGRLQIGSS
jgi:glycogen(starch) synthase